MHTLPFSASPFRLFVVLLSAGVLLSSCSAPSIERGAGLREPLRGSRQLIVVVTSSWESPQGALQFFTRTDDSFQWTPAGERSALTVGSKGLGWGTGVHGGALGDGPVKREGDNRSPAGVFGLSAIYGYAAEGPSFRMPYIPLDSTVECVDDPGSKYYNMIVDRQNVERVDWTSSERMRFAGHEYQWGVVVEHNTNPRIPGDGSCIFLHIWGGPGVATTGCTALSEDELVHILGRLDPAAKPMLVQLPRSEYERLKSAWHLPEIGTASSP